MPLPNWQLFDRLRAFLRKANLFRQDNLFQDQTAPDRIISGGDFIEFSKHAGLLEQTNLQINRLERYKDYDMMDEVGEITLAMDLYADESSLIDPERKHAIIVRSKNKKIKEVVEDFLYNTLLIDRDIRPMIRYLCKYGDYAAEMVPTKNRDGLASLRFINIYNFTRVQTKFGDLVGFYYQDPNTMTPYFLHPWQVAHMRLTSFEQIYHPYGKSLLDGSRKDFKRLRLMEDAALIYRITRAPEKRIFSIPIGQIPSNQIYMYLTEIARQFKKHKFVDPTTGQVNERYSPLIQEDDFFLPKRPDGTGPEVSTLPGAQNLDQIEDILYFKKKMIAGLKIPFSRVGIGEQTESDGRSLSSVSPEFAKATQWVQREMVTGLRKVCVVHLALQGYSIQEIKSFDLSMTAASAIDELYRIETWNTRADIIGTLKESGLFPDDWILERFTDMTRDEIDQLQRDNEEKAAVQAASQEPAAPEDILTMGEAVDDEDQKLINEYKDYEKRIYGRKIVIPDEAEKPLKYRKDPIFENASLEWYVNNNEIDGLPSRDENTLLVESKVPISEIKEVRKQYEILLSYNGVPNENIQRMANSVEEGKQVLSEDTSDQIQESDLPQK